MQNQTIKRGGHHVNQPIKAGDLIGFSGSGWGSVAINLGTYGIPWWSLSHVGVVGNVFSEDLHPNGNPLWLQNFQVLLLFESTIDCGDPCVVRGVSEGGTQAHWLRETVDWYHGRVWHYPLHRPLRPVESVRFTKFLVDNLGRDYDAIGAFRSGGIGFSWIESLLRDEDLSDLFCSEYAAAAYDHVKLFDSRSASRWNPAKLVRRLRRKGILLKPRRLK